MLTSVLPSCQLHNLAHIDLFLCTISATETSPAVHLDVAMRHNTRSRDGYDNSGDDEDNALVEDNSNNHDVNNTTTSKSSAVYNVSDTVITHHQNITRDFDDVDYEDLKFDNDNNGNFPDKDSIYDNSEIDKDAENDWEDYSEAFPEANLSVSSVTNFTSNLASTSESRSDVYSEKNQEKLDNIEMKTSNITNEYFDTLGNHSSINSLNSSYGFNLQNIIDVTDDNGNSSNNVDTEEKLYQQQELIYEVIECYC